MGRHSVPGEGDGQHDGQTNGPDDADGERASGPVAIAAPDAPEGADAPPVAAEAAGSGRPKPGPSRSSGPRTGTGADLELLRRDRTLRARAAAAAIVPMFLYVLVLLVIGRFDVFLVWVWLPVVSAGILVGALLDRAHAARTRALSGVRQDRR